jgi:hypothetical protein
MNVKRGLPSLLCMMLLAGCGLDGPVPGKPKGDSPSAAGQSPETKPATAEKTAPERPTGGVAGAAKQAAGAKPAVIREKAAVGMGEKGRGYGNGMETVAVMALWRAKEKIVLDQMHHAMDLYKAIHDGKAPQTHKDFMEQIIDANHLKLPALPPGQRYVYDPSTEELMIEKPNDPQGP